MLQLDGNRGPERLLFWMVTTWLGWCITTITLRSQRLLGPLSGSIWTAATVFAATGSVLLLQLAAGSANSEWLQFVYKQTVWALAPFAWGMALLSAFPGAFRKGFAKLMVGNRENLGCAENLRCPSLWWVWGVRSAAIAGPLALVLLQPFLGGEEGVLGVQPVELLKYVLVMVASVTAMTVWSMLELRDRHQLGPLPRIPRGVLAAAVPLMAALAAAAWLLPAHAPLIGFMIVCATLLGAVLLVVGIWRRSRDEFNWKLANKLIWVIIILGLISVILAGALHDFSPALIFMLFAVFWLCIVLWPTSLPVPPTTARWVWLVMGATLISAFSFAMVAHFHPDAIPEWIPQRERLPVWADLNRHHQTGNQLARALEFGGEGGWLGNWFGSNGRVMSLPMVQNDFVLSFLLNRFGGLFALLLALFQVIYLTVTFRAGWLCRKAAASSQNAVILGMNNDISRNLRVLFHLSLWGLAWIQASHWAISWGNALALLPVMGQPMTWISSGVSHMIFGEMLLLTSLMGAWAVESEA